VVVHTYNPRLRLALDYTVSVVKLCLQNKKTKKKEKEQCVSFLSEVLFPVGLNCLTKKRMQFGMHFDE
jgi:hypothetical protein